MMMAVSVEVRMESPRGPPLSLGGSDRRRPAYAPTPLQKTRRVCVITPVRAPTRRV
jgi:hypothetical protein